MEAFCGFCVVVEGCFTAITDNTAWFAEAPRSAQEAPRSAQEVSRSAQEVPRSAQ